jgi:hypothetical protein
MFQLFTQHYIQNQNHFDHIHFNGETEMSMEERKLLSSAIQQFQRGENSEGKHLYKFGRDFNNDYFDSVRAFIKEEQSHALVLGRFMHVHRIPLIKGHWIDGVFRKLRNLGGLEWSLIVLSSAEVIATTFYDALRKATSSPALQEICIQILTDEQVHIHYQGCTLNKLNEGRSWWKVKAIRYAHTFLMLGTMLVVWFQYGKIYKAGGYSFRKYFKDTLTEYNRMDRMVAGLSIIPMPVTR